MTLSCTALAASLLAGTVLAQDAPLKWRALSDIRSAYPAKAVEQSVSGKVAIDCQVKQGLTLGPCELLAEQPGSYAFAEATQKALAAIRLNPRQGLRVGDIVSVTAMFEAEGGKVAVKPTLTRSDRKGPLPRPVALAPAPAA